MVWIHSSDDERLQLEKNVKLTLCIPTSIFLTGCRFARTALKISHIACSVRWLRVVLSSCGRLRSLQTGFQEHAGEKSCLSLVSSE